MNWVNIQKGDNWGHVFYTYKGELLSGCGTNAMENALQLEDGDGVRVRFPDGSTTKLPLKARTKRARVYDHGNEYGVTSDRFGVVVKVRGCPQWVELSRLEVEVDSILRHKDSVSVDGD